MRTISSPVQSVHIRNLLSICHLIAVGLNGSIPSTDASFYAAAAAGWRGDNIPVSSVTTDMHGQPRPGLFSPYVYSAMQPQQMDARMFYMPMPGLVPGYPMQMGTNAFMVPGTQASAMAAQPSIAPIIAGAPALDAGRLAGKRV
eukprot:m.71367 g.71367  ORF g.71367 m.71367 type:complete len:144 (-) comp7629_c1_seq2:285-716(-)